MSAGTEFEALCFTQHNSPGKRRRLADFAQRIRLATLESVERELGYLAERPHTLASENADRYLGFQDGAARALELVRTLAARERSSTR